MVVAGDKFCLDNANLDGFRAFNRSEVLAGANFIALRPCGARRCEACSMFLSFSFFAFDIGAKHSSVMLCVRLAEGRIREAHPDSCF